MSNFLVGRGLNDAAYDVFSGTGAQTVFSLTSASSTSAATVSISGVVQRPVTDYSVAGTTLTFVAAPPSGTNNILVQYNKSITIGTPADGTITTAKIATGAVETAKIADGAVTAAKIETAPAIAVDNMTGTLPALDGSALTGIAGITAPTAQATTSGTAVDFTGIPSGTVAIDLFWSDYSCSTAAHGPVIQIGDSGGIETTGYDSNAYRIGSTAVENQTDNFIFMSDSNGMNAGNVASMAGSLRLVNPASNTWLFWGTQARNAANGGFGVGEKSLSGELDRVRFTTNDGDTLSAGIARIVYW